MSEFLTTREVAEYLNINEKQVYRLIREKKIPASRITGKWLFPKALVREWVVGNAKVNGGALTQRLSSCRQLVIAGSNDLALELLLTKFSNNQDSGYTLSMCNIGSFAGLVALQNGNCHVAACHILDPETGEYNSAVIRKHFAELKVTAYNLAYREQGLIVRRGNPLAIESIQDLAEKKVIFVNRQEGSGTRVLLDQKLRESGIDAAAIRGYADTAYTHTELALRIFSGTADAGIGILAAAKMLNLDFIPLATERFDLVIRNQDRTSNAVKALVEVLRSDAFKFDTARMGGYDTHETGKIVYERD